MNEENKNKATEKTAEGSSTFKTTWRAYKAEFRKIVWPSRATLTKHTVTVIIVSLLFGAYIALTDGVLGSLFSRFVQLVS